MITHDLLKKWNACTDGYKRFVQLFPEGADLQTAIDGLVADGHDDWGFWLFSRCKENNLYPDLIAKGYRNAGDRNAGNRNAGNRNAGNRNAGNRNAGDRNAGNWNAGDRNAGDRNAGDRNAGDRNAGDRNAGDMNAGDRNAGNWNAGDRNAGNWNAGNWNAGNWNAGNWNAGYMNAGTPSFITVFDKPCKFEDWEKSYKPNFLFFDTTIWVSDYEMSDQEKIDNPKFYVAEGYLKTIPYKEAFKSSWDKANKKDRVRVKELPNFDANIFFEISGIRVD